MGSLTPVGESPILPSDYVQPVYDPTPIFDSDNLISQTPVLSYAGPGRSGGPTNLAGWLMIAARRSFFGDDELERKR